MLDRPAHTAMFSKSFERQANGCRRAEFQKIIVHCERWGNEGEDHNVHEMFLWILLLKGHVVVVHLGETPFNNLSS